MASRRALVDYDDFIRLIKLYEHPPQLIAYPQPMRSALQRTPKELADLLHHIMPILHAQLDKLCLNVNTFLGIFGLQPAVMVTPSIHAGENELWYTLDYDVFERSPLNDKPKLMRSDAIFINFSTGLIINGDYYMSLIVPSYSPQNAVCFGQIPLLHLQQAWLAIQNKAQAGNADTACVDLCRNYFYPSPSSSDNLPAPQKNTTSSTPFWLTNTDSRLRSSTPSSYQPCNDFSIPSSSFS